MAFAGDLRLGLGNTDAAESIKLRLAALAFETVERP